MKITVEKIWRIDTEGPLKGFADIVIEDNMVIKGLRIVEGKNGLFVGMPQELGKDGKWYNRVAVLNNDVKLQLDNMILAAFEEGI